jgi:hypothetical protein
MKHFPSSWETFVEQLARWGGLSAAARQAFLDGFRPGLSLAADTRSAAVDELRGAGFLADAERSTTVRIDETLTGFHQMMKGLEEHPVFVGRAGPDQQALCAYLAEHYSQKERSALHESIALLPNDLPRVARLVSSVEWLEEFLGREKSDPARELVRFFMEQRDRVPVRDLDEYFPSLGRVAVGAAVALGLRRAVLYLGLRAEDLEPLVGIWPAAARRLHRLAVVLAPRPVAAVRTFGHPWLVEDMTTVLLAAAAEPIRVRRGDERPFSRFAEETAARLLSFPPWLESFTGVTLETRVGLALHGLSAAGLLGPSARGEGAASLRPRTGWRQWALAPLAERVQLLARGLSQGGRGPDGIVDLLDESSSDDEDAPPPGMLRTVLQAFSSVPTTSFIRFADFAEYQAAIGGPSGGPAAGRQRAPGGRPGGPAAGRRPRERGAAPGRAAHSEPVDESLPVVSTDEALEELWKFVLHRVLARAILGLGGAEAGVTDDGRPCFRLTETGRQLLSRADLPAAEPRAPTDIVVQPTFEVVFLSPSPAAEAAVGRFGERVGREVGLLFRLTKATVLRAGAAGMGPRDVLGALDRFSRSPVPPNVVHEIEGWLAAGGGNQDEDPRENPPGEDGEP